MPTVLAKYATVACAVSLAVALPLQPAFGRAAARHIPHTPLRAAKRLARDGNGQSHIMGCPTRGASYTGPCHRSAHAETLWSRKLGCPITRRLHKRLRENPTSGTGGGFDPICRCQGAPGSMTFAVTQMGMDRTLVTVVMSWTEASHMSFTYVTVKRRVGWLVSNIYCQGSPSTSIYNTPVKAC